MKSEKVYSIDRKKNQQQKVKEKSLKGRKRQAAIRNKARKMENKKERRKTSYEKKGVAVNEEDGRAGVEQ